MLHLIPPPLHRRLYRMADAARRLWWRVRRPQRHSVVVVAFDQRGHVLLVRHSYGPRVWSLPGGGRGREEEPEQAAAREIREELGCGVADLVEIDACQVRVSGSLDQCHVFTGRVVGEPVPDMREIVDVVFADPADMLGQCGPRTRRRIEHALAFRRSAEVPSQQR